MTKRDLLEAYLEEIHKFNPSSYFDQSAWADNLLELLGLEIQTSEKLVIK